MIEFDMVNYLESDATLDTLLGSSGSDTKIYPNIPKPQPILPYILYFGGTGDMTDEILDEDRVQLTIRSDSLAEAYPVRNRLKVLLNREDEIQSTIFNTGSTDFIIYNSRYTGGDTLYNPETQEWEITMFFNIIYKNKNWY